MDARRTPVVAMLIVLTAVVGCGSKKEAAISSPPGISDAADDSEREDAAGDAAGSEDAARDPAHRASMARITSALASREPLPADLDQVPMEPKEDPGYKVIKVFYGTDRARAGIDALGLFGPTGWHWIAGVLAAVTFGGILLAFRSGSTSREAEASAFRRKTGRFAFVGLGLLLSVSALVQALSLQGQIAVIRFKNLDTLYGGRRGEMEYGTCEVSIPECHKRGEIERPSLLRLEFRENPLKHLVLRSTSPKPQELFLDELRRDIADAGEGEAFVFVHGYNVTFEAAALRTAQLSYDLEFKGTPIFFSWPSAGYPHLYIFDENNVEWSIPHLRRFLENIVQRSGAGRVHVIAHSMGNRALSRVLERLAERMSGDDSEKMFDQIVMAAPDVDADVFRRDLAPAAVRMARRVTLYASSNDQALFLSKTFHGGYVRAGESGGNLQVVPGIDTIDVSDVDRSMLGHSYIGDNLFVIADLIQLIRTASPPSQRPGLSSRRFGDLVYWGFLAAELPTLPAPGAGLP